MYLIITSVTNSPSSGFPGCGKSPASDLSSNASSSVEVCKCKGVHYGREFIGLGDDVSN